MGKNSINQKIKSQFSYNAAARKEIESCRRGYRLAKYGCYSKDVQNYADLRGWRSEFSEDDIEFLLNVLEPKWPKDEHMKATHFIANLEGLLHYHQIHLWTEHMTDQSRMHLHLSKMLDAVQTLEEGLEPDNVYFLRPTISQKIGTESLSNILKCLPDLRQAIEYRKSLISEDGRPTDGARRFIAVLLANVMDSHGMKPTTSDNGVYVEVLRILLTQQGNDDRPDQIEFLVKEAIREFKNFKRQKHDGWYSPMFIPRLRRDIG